jgi:prepilin-type N-terminal cleavage/methylation domain-containing protein
MNPSLDPSCSRSRLNSVRRGVTLIEVLAGLVLLGTVLSSSLIARGRFLRQAADAERQLTAARAADSLMAYWMSLPGQAVPVPARDRVEAFPGYTWRTRWMPNTRESKSLNVATARLEIFAPPPNDRTPLASVDFLQHVSPQASTPASGAPR